MIQIKTIIAPNGQDQGRVRHTGVNAAAPSTIKDL